MRRILYKLKRRLTPGQFLRLFNSIDLGKKHYTRLICKTGVISDGNVVIRPPFYFGHGNINFGNQVFVNTGCVFSDEAQITIGNGVMLGPQVRLFTLTHDIHPERRRTHNMIAPIVIGNNAWLGSGVVVLPGVTIGENSVIAANSVVTSDVLANALYVGAPARFKKWLIEPDAVLQAIM
ncbi:MAG: DapH/DapD/GlmU-related protein [Pseudomonas sp.]